MIVENDSKIDKILANLPRKDISRITKVVELFQDYGFQLSVLYLKKLTNDIWELRTGRYRLLFGFIKDKAIIVNVFIKKTQKTPKKEIILAVKRIKNYL